MKKIFAITPWIFGILMMLTVIAPASASSIVDTSGPYQDGGYTLDDVREYAIYLMFLILSVVGVLSLGAFVYGGLVFLTSAGNQTQVKKGMDILKAAVIGLVIVFASVLIVRTFFEGLGVQWNEATGKIKF